MFYVKERYQFRGSDGIKWTNWFILDGFKTEQEAKNYLAEYKKKMTKDKLDHEFKLDEEGRT